MTIQKQETEASPNVRAIWGLILIVVSAIAFTGVEYLGALVILAILGFIIGIALILPAAIIGAAKLIRHLTR